MTETSNAGIFRYANLPASSCRSCGSRDPRQRGAVLSHITDTADGSDVMQHYAPCTDTWHDVQDVGEGDAKGGLGSVAPDAGAASASPAPSSSPTTTETGDGFDRDATGAIRPATTYTNAGLPGTTTETGELVERVRGGLDSLKWVLNNAHNWGSPTFQGYRDAAFDDRTKALAALSTLRSRIEELTGQRDRARETIEADHQRSMERKARIEELERERDSLRRSLIDEQEWLRTAETSLQEARGLLERALEFGIDRQAINTFLSSTKETE